jgi:8-oxo-dGTP pyrophosphatase MutT (NUDIX family)
MIDNYQLSVKAILRNADGHILSLETKPEWGFGGLHDVPGGRVDVEEFETHLLKVLAREIEEEVGGTNFEISSIPVGFTRGLITSATAPDGIEKRIAYAFFVADWKGGDIFHSDEHLGSKWIDPVRVTEETLFIPPIQEGVLQYIEALKNEVIKKN